MQLFTSTKTEGVLRQPDEATQMADKKTVHEDKLGPIPDANWENDWTPPKTKVSPEGQARDKAMIERLRKELPTGSGNT